MQEGGVEHLVEFVEVGVAQGTVAGEAHQGIQVVALDHLVDALAHLVEAVDVEGAQVDEAADVLVLDAVGLVEFEVGVTQLAVEVRELGVERGQLCVAGAEFVTGACEFLALAVAVEQDAQEQGGQQACHDSQVKELTVGALERGLVIVADGCQDGRNLAISLHCIELAGTLPCKVDVAVGTVHIAVGHEQIGQFPHGALVHHGVPDVAQRRLCDPIAGLHRVAQQLVVEITVEGHDSEFVGTRLDLLQSHVAIAQGTLRITGIEICYLLDLQRFIG